MNKQIDYPNRIHEIRKKQKISLDALAARMNTSKSQVHALEKGRIRLTVDWMNRIASVLRCKPADLLPDSTRSEDQGLEQVMQLTLGEILSKKQEIRLTEEEKELLDLFRAMDKIGKAQAREVLKALKSTISEAKAHKRVS